MPFASGSSGSASSAGAATRGMIWLLVPGAPSQAAKFAVAVRRALADRGLPAEELNGSQFLRELQRQRGPGDILLVMPGAALPPDGQVALEAFLRRGNHLLTLSSTAFSGLSQPPLLETLSPSYKTYRTRADRLQFPDKVVAPVADGSVIAPMPRARGLGTDAVRPTRFIPVVEALDVKAEPLGAAGHLYLNTGGAYAGSVWGALGLSPAELEASLPDSARLVMGMIERIRRGLFFADAGPGHFAYAAGERVACGADLVNLGDEPQTVDVSISIMGDGRRVHDWSASVTVPARCLGQPLHVALPPLSLPAGVYAVAVRAHREGTLIDELSCPVRVVAFATPSPREVVGVDGGEFVLDGKPWHPLGMNYWPHLSVGLEPRDFSRHWLSPEQYDPDQVERDLSLAERLGLNVLSIQYTDPGQAGSLMDFMARAAVHGLKVNIYLPALEPLHPDLEAARRMIIAAHLPESPALFAYDLCWEGHLGPYDARCASDGRWQAWVIDRYGSIADAEVDWRFSPARTGGVITGPTDEQVTHEGPWRVFVAAYRRFWDDEISRRYRMVREAIRAVDPVHLIGARSGYGGNGTPMYAHHMPFDLASGAAYLDFISPEGYALSGGRADFLKGAFTTAYARLIGAGKPVFWAEYGVPLRWQAAPLSYRAVETAGEMEPQRAYFHNMLQFVRESGASGCSGWWWPGGFRVDERSDFGIVNPDGTLRPAADELRRSARDYAGAWAPPRQDGFVNVDRDDYVNGYAGLYTAMAGRYAEAFLRGHAPALRTGGTGSTSADTPPLAVGDVPWNGHNPPKHLNAEFTLVELRNRDGWRRLENGGKVAVAAGKVWLRVSVANTAEARWLPPGGNLVQGGVFLNVRDDRGGVAMHPLPAEVAFLGFARFPEFSVDVAPIGPTDVVLGLVAEKRTDFGERFRVRLAPQGDGVK